MSKSKKNLVLNKIVALLDKLSNRITLVSRRTDENTNEIFALNQGSKATFDSLQAAIKTAGDREARQTLRDQNNVQALRDLRDSAQKAFTQVKADMDGLLKIAQRLNERVGQVESQNIILAKQNNAIACETLSAAKSSLPNGHVWVNQKLSGVYDSVDEMEARIQKLENIQAIYENLRKAQNDFAIANGAFLAGLKA